MLNSSPDRPQLALHTQPYQASSDRRPSLPVSLYLPKLSVDDDAPQEPLKEQVNNNHKYRSKPKPKEKKLFRIQSLEPIYFHQLE